MKKRIYYIIGIIMSIIFVTLFIPYKQALVFSFENTNKALAYLPADMRNNTFQIEFTHTIHLSDVVETYTVDIHNEIHQIEFEFEDFNVGMPSNATGEEIFIEKNGKYYVTNMDRPFPYLDLRVARTIPKHNLLFNDQKYSLLTFLEPGTWTRVQSKRLNVWQQMKGVNILGE